MRSIMQQFEQLSQARPDVPNYKILYEGCGNEADFDAASLKWETRYLNMLRMKYKKASYHNPQFREFVKSIEASNVRIAAFIIVLLCCCVVMLSCRIPRRMTLVSVTGVAVDVTHGFKSKAMRGDKWCNCANGGEH